MTKSGVVALALGAVACFPTVEVPECTEAQVLTRRAGKFVCVAAAAVEASALAAYRLKSEKATWEELGAVPQSIPNVGACPDGQLVARDGTSGWKCVAASSGGASSWAALTDKPSTFPPAVHGHPWSDVTGKPAVLTAAEVEALLDDAAQCPRLALPDGSVRRYARDTSAAGILLCKAGSDEVVKVGDFWIDRYEASLVAATQWNGGACDGSGTPYGTGATDDYPLGFPDNGNWTTPVYVCSVAGGMPSGSMTWFQAQQACSLAGKRLCRNDEWQQAVAGTPDPGSSPGTNGACVTTATGPRATGLAGANAGIACRSNYGAEDMIGNLLEWTAEWWQGGMPWETSNGDARIPWMPGYGDDTTVGLNGMALDGTTYRPGLPGVALRGGYWEHGTQAGVFHLLLDFGPTATRAHFGARCCAGGR